ncbi:hypothetical protein [Desulfoscipio geothermicus]|uniref:Uncharacterized protein n=1 Tax=Desulfoscipio geothermicus DSM 3669 TaxID=1121426 RepID=A0A1I6CN86_9FIRM|nr:hypothetical protein [Desulfoscipio geothermicus]SFQ94613.1 hypothetical protein SAMN05660706_10112 [Desulfoscipio geothermicus DSM 3669]
MSAISQTGDHCGSFAVKGFLRRLLKSLTGFARTKTISRTAKIFHGDYAYDLIPDTAINDFMNMRRVTSVDAGDCYVCIFEKPLYQGGYFIIGPGERADVGACGSVIVGMQKFSVNMARKNARLPDRFWELSGPMYQWHFAAGYRYV